METLAIAAAYAAYETTHELEPIELDFSWLKVPVNSRWLSYIGILILGSQVTLGSGAIAEATVLSQPITNATVNVQSGCLNVRVAPNGDRLKCLPKGSALPDIVREENGWYQLSTGNWVAREYVSGISVKSANSSNIQSPTVEAATSTEDSQENLQYVKGNLMKGSAVEDLQTNLNYYKLLDKPIAIDGVFGTKTKLAVIAFQEQRGLEMDGVVGAATRQALGL
ncbi:Peptidoglycan-binding domain 1 protein [[Leptolyngbya] sp. PCC 7376]|uniref:peptidoglycan-binding domain-containing protein n=1 Tax=[Leptolyngbya] sp. PCC 7376 TaxID=111781 RepID=UPI00029ECA76|nr:peptidoglycan-binding domain-containing protein [[Leptolyngbya] sp. PCC 7376]AFY37098.1 Peptidoglycan-binding domain 1 protein [[Leptolyngbya] sp. PCC 7376]